MRTRDAGGRFVRAGRDTLRLRRGAIAFRITKIAGGGLELRDHHRLIRVVGIGHLHPAALVRHHEDVAVGTIRGAQTTTDTVIFNHDLEMLAAMNRIDRAARHAMGIAAGPAGSRDEEISKATPVAQQPGDGKSVRSIAMLPDATFGAFVTAGAEIHVQNQNALALVEPLLDVIGHQRIAHAFAAQGSERLLHETAPEDRKQAYHFEKIRAAQTGQLEVVQGRAGRCAHAGGNGLGQIRTGILQRRFQFTIDLLRGSVDVAW